MTAASKHQEARYYAADTYLLPSDEEEKQRLEAQYRNLLSCTKELLPADLKIEEGDSILDAGTGTGIWLNDVAATVPSSVSLVGTDIEGKLFPPPLPNQTFLVQSSLALPPDWSSRFALVHQALMGLAFSAEAWTTITQDYLRVLKPGGIVTLHEMDVLWSLGGATVLPPYSARALAALKKLCALRNLDPEMYPKIAGMLEAAGFEEVKMRKVEIPMVIAGKDTPALRSSIDAWKGMKGGVIKLGGLGIGQTEEEFDEFMEAMSAEWRTGEESIPYVIWTARKPL